MDYKLYNTELNPKLWDKDKDGKFVLKKDIRDALMRIADDFVADIVKDGDIKLKAEDVIIVGSSVNYNWTEYSDLDLHVVADFSKMDYSEKDCSNLFFALRSGWNKDHNITVKGLDVEVFVQDGVDSVDSDAIYSVKNNKWIKYPVVENPKFNKKVIIRKHKEFKRKIEALLKSEGPKTEPKLKKLLEKLYKYRQAGLNKGGEFSEENIVFKILRAQGYIDKIKQVVRKLYDKERSLAESLKRDLK